MVDERLVVALEEVLATSGVRSLYQPIVDLETKEVVAFEALARGPEGSPLESPAALFSTARAVDRLDELDWACRAVAVRGALEANLGTDIRLLVNVEPEVLGSHNFEFPPEFADLLADAMANLSVTVEFTERAIAQRPAELLTAADVARSVGFGVAIDDVGAVPESLALMPLLRPDVVKLDLALVQQRPTVEIAAVVNAVHAYAEETGATILAEGIEMQTHADQAVAMGARLGQGWLFGRPGPLPQTLPRSNSALPILLAPPLSKTTPFELSRDRIPLRHGQAPLLVAISRHIEHHAFSLPTPPVVVGAFQAADRFAGSTAALYESIADHAALVAALGAGMPERPTANVLGASLAADDALRGEWAVCVVGAHFSAALIARELEGDRSSQRTFEFGLTHNRELVVDATRALLARVTP